MLPQPCTFGKETNPSRIISEMNVRVSFNRIRLAACPYFWVWTFAFRSQLSNVGLLVHSGLIPQPVPSSFSAVWKDLAESLSFRHCCLLYQHRACLLLFAPSVSFFLHVADEKPYHSFGNCVCRNLCYKFSPKSWTSKCFCVFFVLPSFIQCEVTFEKTFMSLEDHCRVSAVWSF